MPHNFSRLGGLLILHAYLPFAQKKTKSTFFNNNYAILNALKAIGQP